MTAAARLRAGSNLRLGVVASFEAGRGLGTVTELEPPAAEAGSEGERSAPASFSFHSTAIADRSRRIEAGTAVAFVVLPAHGGRLEARELHRLGSAG